jgi:high-affinity nickel permease
MALGKFLVVARMRRGGGAGLKSPHPEDLGYAGAGFIAMTSGLAMLMVGFLLGMRHATDPDHVVAVSTIVSRERSIVKAGLIGILWGCGHTITIVVVGAAIIVFGMAIPAHVGLTMEFSVGLMLILLGVLNLTGAMSWLSQKFSPAHPKVIGEHAHLHEHNAQLHLHWHSHGSGVEHHAASLTPPARMRAPFARLGVFHALRPFFVGIVHGLAGSAAVALLVLSTIRNPKWAVLYLLIFGVGTIAGMMLITAAIALPFSFAGHRFPWVNKGLIAASGVVSVAFGIFICYRIGMVDGLFSGHPIWTPS